MAYCPEQLGDKFVSDFYEKLKTVMRGGVKCHEHSDSIWWGADCKDLIDKLGPTYRTFMWRFYYYNATQGFLNTPWAQNNTKCVKSQVTELLYFDEKNPPTPAFAFAGLSLAGLLGILGLF